VDFGTYFEDDNAQFWHTYKLTIETDDELDYGNVTFIAKDKVKCTPKGATGTHDIVPVECSDYDPAGSNCNCRVCGSTNPC